MNLFNLTAELTLDNSQYSKALQKSESDVEQFGNANKKASEDVEQFGNKSKESAKKTEQFGNNTETANNKVGGLGNGVTTVSGVLKTMGAVLVGIIGSMVLLSTTTERYKEDMNKLTLSFESQGFSAKQAKGIYKDLFGILGESERSVEASNHLAELTNSEKDLSKWGVITAGVMAKFGDSLPIESLTESANETAKTGQVTGALADALNWAGISEDEFNQKLAGLNTEQQRANLITKTLNGEYSELGQNYQKANADIIASRNATTALNDKLSELGEVVRPLITKGKEMIVQLIESLQPLMPIILAIVNFLIENMPLVLSILGALVVVLLAATAAQIALNVAMIANPIGIIITAIIAVIAAIVIFLATNKKARQAIVKFFNLIKNSFLLAFHTIKDFFAVKLPSAFKTAVNWLQSKIKWLINFGRNIPRYIWNGIVAMKNWLGNKIKDWFTGIWDGAKKAFDGKGGGGGGGSKSGGGGGGGSQQSAPMQSIAMPMASIGAGASNNSSMNFTQNIIAPKTPSAVEVALATQNAIYTSNWNY